MLARTYRNGEVVLNPNCTVGADATVHQGLHTLSGTRTDDSAYVGPQLRDSRFIA